MSFGLLMLITLTWAIVGLVQIEMESRQFSGHELLGTAIAFGTVLIIATVSFVCEVSIYFNLRYFLLSQNKTTLKTVFNIIIFAATVCLVASLGLMIATWSKISEILVLLLFGFLLLLRFVYAVIQSFKKDSVAEA